MIGRFTSSVPDEVDDVLLEVVEGAIPADLRGVLFRNGPGRLERGGFKYGHVFDGDGMVSRVEFTDEGARYRNRFVRTREFLREESEGRIRYRGFGTNRPGGVTENAFRTRFKNAANTSVVFHGGRLLALWEGGWPHELDPRSLSTTSRYGFAGRLKNARSPLDCWLNPELPFSAHPSVDAKTGELFNFGMAFGLKNRLMLYRVSPDGVMDEPRALELDRLAFVHDMLATPDYLVFVLADVSFNIPLAVLGRATPVGSLSITDRPLSVLVVEKESLRRSGEPRVMRLETRLPGFVFHLAGARQRGHEISFVGAWYWSFPELGSNRDLFSVDGAPDVLAKPLRFRVDLAQKTVDTDQIDDISIEMPTSGLHEDVFAIGCPRGRKQPLFSSLAHIDADGKTRTRDFGLVMMGEPVVTTPGWVTSLVANGATDTSELWIMDPGSLDVVCRLALPHRLPPGLHGTWVPPLP